MSRSSDRRFIHLWLPRLSADRSRLQDGASARPLALTIRVKGAQRLQAVDARAEAEGLRPGMTLADARTRVPELQGREADLGADAALLQRLAPGLRRDTPAVALAPPDGADLDITGAAVLFGSERRLAENLQSRLGGLGLQARLGLADTPGLARALARFSGAGERPVAAASPDAAQVLAPLPVEALELEGDGVATLRGLGLVRMGQILDLPRSALARRFGEPLLQRLDAILGQRGAPLRLDLERPPYLVERNLAEPIASDEAILNIIKTLSERLGQRLEMEGQGGRRFVLELFRLDGAVKRLEVAASRPLRDPRRIAALFAERLAGLNEGLEADYGFDLLRLWAGGTQALQAERLHLLDEEGESGVLAALLDRIAARDGLEVKRLVPRDAHRPAQVLAPATPDAAGHGAWRGERPPRFADTPLRPLRLFSPPQPIEEVTAEVPEGPPARFRWRRVWRRVSRAEGPERLEAEGPSLEPSAPVRDYYRLEDDLGRRYWVFREGLYGQGAPPRWFLHGLFG